MTRHLFTDTASGTDSMYTFTCRCGGLPEADEHCSPAILQAAMLRTDHELRHQLHRHLHNADHVIVDPAAYPTALSDSHQTMTLVREAYRLKVIEAAVSATASLTGSAVCSSAASTCSCSTSCRPCVGGNHSHHNRGLPMTTAGEDVMPLFTYGILQQEIAEYHHQHSPFNDHLEAAGVYGNGTATYYPRADAHHETAETDGAGSEREPVAA
ncbi:hypothetical protein STCU_10561 [Strigomonas culicis]|uniref:Uncharacterized protein n=1 Tax=Strigomonas culicis TaxID=28005 RepID=S9USJ3_9TRYP|nr:hypothetical protein STCU_10561 [Strigomonas culicis]|eukprot:EPY17526.1 hypothetical protein STCU_10561 [Strigomonas culicis]